MSESISFEPIADTYDQTRGGLVRGRNFAPAISAQLGGAARIIEIGIGTGAIALPLTEHGHEVFGCDISPAMLRRAHERIGARVVVADAASLPFPDECCDAVVAVWVLHVVADQQAVVAECRRVLRPGGRLAVVYANAEEEPNDVSQLVLELHHGSGRRRTLPDDIGLTPISRDPTDVFEFDESPNRTADVIEARTWSWLWDLDEEQWAAWVQPYVDRLRALPNPDQPRHRTQSHPLLVFEK